MDGEMPYMLKKNIAYKYKVKYYNGYWR